MFYWCDNWHSYYYTHGAIIPNSIRVLVSLTWYRILDRFRNTCSCIFSFLVRIVGLRQCAVFCLVVNFYILGWLFRTNNSEFPQTLTMLKNVKNLLREKLKVFSWVKESGEVYIICQYIFLSHHIYIFIHYRYKNSRSQQKDHMGIYHSVEFVDFFFIFVYCLLFYCVSLIGWVR